METQNNPIQTNSAARLHLGFLDMWGCLGRKFGSIGISLNEPTISITAQKTQTQTITAPDAHSKQQAEKYTNKFYENEQIQELLEPNEQKCSITINQTIPPHIGLGSGTQTALCITKALCLAHGINATTKDLALISGRGLRSGIGIESFATGGFNIDGGSADPTTQAPTTILRHNFPREWRIITIIPPGDGLSGTKEKTAFKEIEKNEKAAQKICHNVLMKVLPGILEKDIQSFGEGIEQIQQIMGEQFSQHQNGSYTSPYAPQIIKEMKKATLTGTGQSSWGPTLYGFAPNEKQALQAVQQLKQALQNEQIKITINKARNHGAW